MKSRRLNLVRVGRFWNFLKLRFIHHPLFKISFYIFYGIKAYYSVGSIQKLASYTKHQDDQWKLLKIAVFQTPLFTCLEPIGRSFDINIRMSEFSKYCCFHQNKVFIIFNYYEPCYNPIASNFSSWNLVTVDIRKVKTFQIHVIFNSRFYYKKIESFSSFAVALHSVWIRLW